jgi:hypothetical protein
MNKNEAPQIQVEILQTLPVGVQEYIMALQKLLERQVSQNQDLANQLAQNSQNSSKPPSSVCARRSRLQTTCGTYLFL